MIFFFLSQNTVDTTVNLLMFKIRISYYFIFNIIHM